MPAFITTDRLFIRPRTRQDLTACLAMDRDPEVTKYIAGPWQDPDAHKKFLKARMRATYPEPLGYWTITRLEKRNEFLGWVMLLPADDNPGTIEIGWRFTRATWGQGIATEATRALLDMLRNHKPEFKVTATIHADNLGSLKVAQKLGLKFFKELVIDGTREYIFETSVTELPHTKEN